MKCQSLFSEKTQKKKTKQKNICLSSTEFAQNVVKVKEIRNSTLQFLLSPWTLYVYFLNAPQIQHLQIKSLLYLDCSIWPRTTIVYTIFGHLHHKRSSDQHWYWNKYHLSDGSLHNNYSCFKLGIMEILGLITLPGWLVGILLFVFSICL